MSNDIFSSVLANGALYGFDLHEAQASPHRPSRGQFRCIDFLTGRQYWSTGSPRLRRKLETSQADAGRRIGHATVLVADGKLFLLNDAGELILARATTAAYEELGRVTVLGGDICWTQPTLNNGRLFVRNHSRAACLYVGEPHLLPALTRAAALTAADIPQSRYADLFAVRLGIEADYVFDMPGHKWLRQWFYISLLGILGLSFLLALGARLVLGPRLTSSGVHWLFWTIAFLLGAAGTTVMSKWTGDFVFTWPVSIFVAFQATVFEMRLGTQRPARGWSRWRGRLVAVIFVACCLAYFMLCRRLSLIFECAFLCGFAAALPFSLAGTHLFQERRWWFVWRCLMTAAAFASFYWSSVAVLRLIG